MRIDVHTHIFPPHIIQDRSRFFEGEPAFRLLYESPKAKLASTESLLQIMDRDDIDRAVVFGFPWNHFATARGHNDYVLEAAARHPQRLIPLACMNPLGRNAVSEAERCFQAGAKGLGELAIYGDCEASHALGGYQDLIDCCRSWQGVLMVHANEPVGHWYPGKAPLGMDFYYQVARRAQGVPLIFAHWGGGLGFYELLKKEVRDVLVQVYYDTAASPYLYRSEIYGEMVRIVGAAKILFGSDYPLLAPERYIREIATAGLDPDCIQAIFGGNAARLFGIGP
jgi:uncharacterized protein